MIAIRTCVRAAVCLLLTTTAVLSADDWSWGTEAASAPAESHKALPKTRQVHLPPPLEPRPPQSVSSKVSTQGDRQSRFLGLHKTLCSLGIGLNCNKNTQPHYPNTLPGQGFISSPHPTLGDHLSIPPSPLDVTHHHSHTHVHLRPDTRPTSVTGGFPPSAGQPTPHGFSLYHDKCQCVHASFCSSYDIVARNNPGDLRDLIDARSRTSDILSNETHVEENVATTPAPGGHAAPHTTGRQAKILDIELKNETRVRRDTLDNTHKPFNATHDTEARTLFYYPGAAGCGAAYVCCRNPQVPPRPSKYSCGRSYTSGVAPRIKTPQYVKGNTEFGEYPWQAAILKHGDEYVCGGVLIDERHILTAAHCVDGLIPHQLKVRLGEWDVYGPTEFYRHVEMQVEFVALHPGYYAGNLHNDIAVIRMHRYVDFSAHPHISPVCLPDSYSTFVGQRCHSTGWGKDAFGSQGKYQTILQEVEVPVVDHYRCQQALRSTRLGPSFNLQQGMLCAGGEEGRDTCQGDGGGPLVCPGPEGRFQLAGLVSWGVGCGLRGIPGVYVDVVYYLQWLHAITSAP